MRIQSLHLDLKRTVIFCRVNPVRVEHILPRTHPLKAHSSGVLSECWKPVGLEPGLVRIFCVFSDGTFDLFSAWHSIEFHESLLLGGESIGIFLEMRSDLVGLVLLSEEVGCGSVEVVLMNVSRFCR